MNKTFCIFVLGRFIATIEAVDRTIASHVAREVYGPSAMVRLEG